MRIHVALFDSGPVQREGGSIYINVLRADGEVLTELQERRWWAGVCSPGNPNSSWQRW